jgi:predicted aldo/keto reductase-like oxidoreductase
MRYRRFGRTELNIPVLSCGGMRYQHRWSDLPLAEIPPAEQENLEATIHRAIELGINHIETARGYGTSEMQLGQVLPKLPRDRMLVQTKVAPSPTPEEFLERFNASMDYLKLDYVDLLSFHGVNTLDLLNMTVRKGGCLEAARGLQRDGRVRFVGFSTHAPTSVILKTVDTGEFDYMNVHWYWVNDYNRAPIEAAAKRDMGVFIISPTDKGGMLQAPPEKMVNLCAPLAPMQFNDLYCLNNPNVHTLSVGAARPSDFDAHIQALDHYDTIESTIEPILTRLRREMAQCVGADWAAGWWKGLPECTDMPNELNVQEIVRLWTFLKSYHLEEWAKSRYNLLGHADHWQPGNNAGEFDEAAILAAVKDSPFALRIPEVLREAHAMLYREPAKRQSES